MAPPSDLPFKLFYFIRSMVKMNFYAKKSYANCPDIFLVISAEFAFEMCAAAKNCREKRLKTCILRVQSHSKSSLMLVMTSSMYLSLCNRFHVTRANSDNMGVGTGEAEGAAAPPTFGAGEQAIALAPPKSNNCKQRVRV